VSGGGSNSTDAKLTHGQSPLASLSRPALADQPLAGGRRATPSTSPRPARTASPRVAVYSDEPDEDQTGDGNFPGRREDRYGDLFLRAERKGNSDGRVYLIITTAMLPNGPTGVDCDTVTVPKSQANTTSMP
jgi:hypothetical protein